MVVDEAGSILALDLAYKYTSSNVLETIKKSTSRLKTLLEIIITNDFFLPIRK
ncbi:MAG: hypothetical protein ACTSRP_02785 [Candidatus Helarchaeota archaeon]